MNWCIEPKSCLVIIPCLPSRMLDADLAKWVYGHFPAGNIKFVMPASDGRYPPVVPMRNMVARDVLAGAKDFENIVFFDNDLRPDHRLEPMFQISADVCGAMYATDNPSAWLMPDSIHAAAMRFHRRVLEALQPPFFMHKYDEETGTRMTCCDCGYFVQKAKAAGFSVARAGYSDHGNLKSWC